MKQNKKELIFYPVFVVVLIFIDQITKFFAYKHLKGTTGITVINNVFEFQYAENESAAFGIDLVTLFHKIFDIEAFHNDPKLFLNCKMAFLYLITIAVFGLIIYFFVRLRKYPKFNKLRVLLIFYLAGGLGNLIDRIWHKYVIDFLYFKLIDFPIFNVADIYVTVATFIIIVLCVFYYKEEDYNLLSRDSKKKKEERKKNETS